MSFHVLRNHFGFFKGTQVPGPIELPKVGSKKATPKKAAKKTVNKKGSSKKAAPKKTAKTRKGK